MFVCVCVCVKCVCLFESTKWREIGVSASEGGRKRGGKEQWLCRVLNEKSVVH